MGRTFKNLRHVKIESGELPLSFVIGGVVVSATALCVIQNVMLDMPIWMTLTAIVLSVPLMLVGLRVLGETNWGPISALSNMMQGVFASSAPRQHRGQHGGVGDDRHDRDVVGSDHAGLQVRRADRHAAALAHDHAADRRARRRRRGLDLVSAARQGVRLDRYAGEEGAAELADLPEVGAVRGAAQGWSRLAADVGDDRARGVPACSA